MNQKTFLINEVIEEEDEEKNKFNKNKENDNNKNSKDILYNNMEKKERNIKYIPYNKINIRKYNRELLSRIKDNCCKNVFSSENNNDTSNNNLMYNEINYNTHSSYKNIFCNHMKLSSLNNNMNDKIDRRKNFHVKGKSLSNRLSNSNKNIFKGKSFNNNCSLKEKIKKEKNPKESTTLPELNPNSVNNTIINRGFGKIHKSIKKLSNFKEKTIFDEKLKYPRTKSVSSSDKIKINYNNSNKICKNSINNFSSSTSAYTNSTKKINPNNNVTDDLSKYRLGLLSAGTSSYNNVIIPMLSLKRPESNLNFGGGKLWSNLSDANNNKNIKKEVNEYEKIPKEKEDNNIILKNSKTIVSGILSKNKITNKNQVFNEKLTDSENNDLISKNYNKLMPKFHKIKIEKGMMNTKIANSLGKNLVFKYYNQNNINKF